MYNVTTYLDDLSFILETRSKDLRRKKKQNTYVLKQKTNLFVTYLFYRYDIYFLWFKQTYFIHVLKYNRKGNDFNKEKNYITEQFTHMSINMSLQPGNNYLRKLIRSLFILTSLTLTS